MHHFLQFSLPLPYAKLKLEKNSGHASNVVCGGEGRGWTCVNWKTPHQRKSVPRRLSMIVRKWSPPPPRVLSRWRCLAYCWRLGQEVLVFLRLMVRPNSLQVCAKELQAPSEIGRLWCVSQHLTGPGLPRLRRAVAARWDTMIPPTVGDSPYHLDLHQLVWAYNS